MKTDAVPGRWKAQQVLFTWGRALARYAPQRLPGIDIAMIDDREIWACANQLIKQHGADAWFTASQRADALLADGEMEGHRTFVRILARIRQLEQLAPDSAVH